MEKRIDKDGWIICPNCDAKTRTKVLKSTVLENLPVYCPKCKRQFIVSVKYNKIIKFELDAKTQGP